MSEEERRRDEDAEAILNRRRFLIGSALAGAGIGAAAVGCDHWRHHGPPPPPKACLTPPPPKVCLTIVPPKKCVVPPPKVCLTPPPPPGP